MKIINLAEIAFSEDFYLLEELVKVVLILSRDVTTLVDERRIRCFEGNSFGTSIPVNRVWCAQVQSSPRQLIAKQEALG